MRIFKIIFLLAAVFLLIESCATTKWKESLVSTGSINDAVNNIITDFMNTSKLSKMDSIFSIIITDTKDGIVIIGIGGAVNKIYPKLDFAIGTYDNIFPTRYLRKGNKLFYWNDSTQVITQEIVEVLKRYDHIDFSWSEEYIIPPLVIDDGKESVVYYLCKDNYTNYKKTGGNTITKYYPPPKLNCNN